MIIIRKAAFSDAALIADLSRETFYDTFAAFNSAADMDLFMETQFSRELLMAELYLPLNHFYIAEEDGVVVGYTRLRENNNPPNLEGLQTLEIARIYAIKDYLGKGVGEQLMKHALLLAEQLGKEIVWLGVWTNNARAIRFYTRWGFEKFSDHIFMLGNDPQTDWLMKKVIVPQNAG